MTETLDSLIESVDSDEGYLAEAWLLRLRTFEFSHRDAARFLLWLPKLQPHLGCCEINLSHGTTDLDRPAALIEFHTGGWSGAEELISAMLGHFWIAHLHAKWSRGGHFTFEVPETLPERRTAHAPASTPERQEAPPPAPSRRTERRE